MPGVFDAIVVGDNAIPILGSTLREDSRLFQALAIHDTPVYMALDHDAEKKAEWIIKSLLKYDLEVFKIPIDEADVGDWAGMEKRIKTLEDAVADLKKDKEPRSEETKDEKDIEVDAKEEDLSVKDSKEELSEPAVQPIKHSPEGNFKKETAFQFSKKRPKSVLDTVMEQIINN